MSTIWKWLLVENHRKALGFLGAGLATLIAAAWTLFVYFDGDKVRAAPRAREDVTVTPKPEMTEAEREDERLRKMLVGRWDGGRRRYPSNVVLDVSYSFSTDGTYNWTGEGAFYTVVVSGDWRVKDGHTTVEIISSTMPQMAPPGSKYTSRIEALTETSYTYTDAITGEQVTDRRVR